MNKRVAILVSRKYSKESPFIDDVLLSEALAKKGIEADIIVWDDTDVDMSIYNAAVIRSCWDYDTRSDEFLNRMRDISRQCMILNPLDMIIENSNKIYLSKLSEKGIPIVPTIFDLEDDTKLPSAWEEVVIKPSVSSSGRDTYRYKATELEDIRLACEDIKRKGKTPLIQKFISSVESMGEYSSVIIDGVLTFTMNKIPKEGQFLVHKHFGGTYTHIEASKEQIDFINSLLSKLDEIPLYMRIDYLKCEKDGFMLLELEQIEPYIYLAENRDGLKLMVKGIAERTD